MKVSHNFYIQEFVPKYIYDKFGSNSIWFVDPKVFFIAQFLRDRYNKGVTINDWMYKEQFLYQWSGFRTPRFEKYSETSQHSAGRAIDVKVTGMTSEEVFDDIVSHQGIFMQAGLSAIEDVSATPTWTHLDCRPSKTDKLIIVKP